MTAPKSMCPHCGTLFAPCDLTPWHPVDAGGTDWCPGSQQYPRNPESDARPLWSGGTNPYFAGAVSGSPQPEDKDRT